MEQLSGVQNRFREVYSPVKNSESCRHWSPFFALSPKQQKILTLGMVASQMQFLSKQLHKGEEDLGKLSQFQEGLKTLAEAYEEVIEICYYYVPTVLQKIGQELPVPQTRLFRRALVRVCYRFASTDKIVQMFEDWLNCQKAEAYIIQKARLTGKLVESLLEPKPWWQLTLELSRQKYVSALA